MAENGKAQLNLLRLEDLSLEGWLMVFAGFDESDQLDVVARMETEFRAVLKPQKLDSVRRVDAAVELFLALTETPYRSKIAALLLTASFYYSRIGRGPYGLGLARRVLRDVVAADDLPMLRKLHNVLGVLEMEAADFRQSLDHFESALTLAYRMNDSLQITPCLANVAATLKVMGQYQDSIRISFSILKLELDTPATRVWKFQCATNGLFCAHRIQDAQLAFQFLTAGNELIDSIPFDPVMKATYEYYRASYLVDTFDHETAEELIQAAKQNLGVAKNPRVDILLQIAEALCDWARRDDAGYASSRAKLRALYEVTKKSKLDHDDVLRALMKVHGNAMDHDTARLGMRYAKELVEFTTNVKRAKFYRQLSDRGVDLDPSPPKLPSPFDPFANVRRSSLALSDEPLPTRDALPSSVLMPATRTKPVDKHEELSVIHDDLAKLRMEAVVKEIRSVAYDTAENWALAAEFFDDQTGQHCFRVGHLAAMLAREIGMEDAYCARIEHAARLHDLGKIGVNEMILLKPGPLDPSELTAMRAHAEVGAHMLQGTKDPVLQMAAVIAKHHHEWWNGAGYPASLGDRSIPLAARICALADVYDALTHVRPYKGAWPHRVAVEEMLNLAGVQFDPHLIRPFLRVLERYVPALKAGRIPGLEQLKTNSLIVSREKLMETISGAPA